MPPLVPAGLLAAASLFKRHTGLGADQFHPRWVKMLTLQALVYLCRLYSVIEERGEWPRLLNHLLIAFLPKPQGGVRPIVLFSGLYRL